MNSLVSVLLIVFGAVLIFAAIKGQDPREILKNALRKGQ